MPADPNPMDAIASLMAERDRFESWLSSLETKREATPAHVFARVHADYQARLDAVIEQLSGRASELEATAKGLASRVGELHAAARAREDERAEAELRAMVGEFDTTRWDEMRSRADAELARLANDRAGVGAELARVQEILRVATTRRTPSSQPDVVPAVAPAAAPPAAPQPEVEIPAVVQMPDPLPSREEQAAAAPAANEDAPLAGADFDELAFLKSVMPQTPPAAAVPQPAPAAQPAPSPEPVRAPSEQPRQFADATARLADAPATPTPVDRPAVTNARRLATPLSAQSVRQASATRASVPPFLRDVPSEQVKTLKCAECGTMNFATEWYCERCGGELAAM